MAMRYKTRWETVSATSGAAALRSVDAAALLNSAEGDSTAWLKKYRGPAIQAILQLENLGVDAAYFVADTEALPMQSLTWAGQQNIALIASIGTVFNTDRLTEKERATAIVSNNIIPAMQTLASVFRTDPPPYMSAFIVYRAGAAGTQQDAQTHAEIVGLIVASTRLAEFTAHHITDQELVDQSVVLMSAGGPSRKLARLNVALQ